MFDENSYIILEILENLPLREREIVYESLSEDVKMDILNEITAAATDTGASGGTGGSILGKIGSALSTSPGKGAAIGGALGAGAAALGHMKKMSALKKKYAACQDDTCKQYVKKEMWDLRKKSLLKGAGATAAGAGAGALAGKYGSRIANSEPVQNARTNVQNRFNTARTRVSNALGNVVQGAAQRWGAGVQQGAQTAAQQGVQNAVQQPQPQPQPQPRPQQPQPQPQPQPRPPSPTQIAMQQPSPQQPQQQPQRPNAAPLPVTSHLHPNYVQPQNLPPGARVRGAGLPQKVV